MRISARIALPAAAVVASATALATLPAFAASNTEATVRPSAEAANTSALKQEKAAIQRQRDAEQLTVMRAAVVANWQQEAAAAQAAAEAAAAQAAAEAAALAEAEAAAAAEEQRIMSEAVVAQWQAEAAAAAPVYSAPAAPAAATSTASASGSWSGSGAVGAAMAMLGQPYVSGGQAPGGFDCSGLVKWAYGQAGVSLPGGSYNQIGYGTAVSLDSLAPGDLVFYGPGGSQHVAIYIGGGQVVQASNYDTGVHTASIYYIGEPSAFRRI